MLQIKKNQENNAMLVSSCNTTCPEDCSAKFVTEFHKGDNTEENVDIIIGCSTYPNISESVKDCMKDFDYTKHPNAKLLPKTCGKQKSGWSNSVREKV